MRYIVYLHGYFDNRVECCCLSEIKKHIHKNITNDIRVQIGDFRLLLIGSKDGKTMQIDGYSDLSEMYKYFNNHVTGDGLSQILTQSVYVDHFSEDRFNKIK